mmetsp:Transcript_63872/g.101520  ORF Transcript_63872/g.101520 Transcript_63872/m.101520 type:complete len:202 (-) Transcript_63872:1905-2510(-)
MVRIWQSVGRAVHILGLLQGLCQQLSVGSRCRSVAIAPHGEDLHLASTRLTQGLHLLSQEGWEEDDRTEEDHGRHLLRENVQQGCIERNARTLSEAHDHHLVPVEAELPQLGLDGFQQATTQELHVMQHIQVLVLEALSISEVKGSIHHFGRFQGELVESLTGRMIRPGQRHQGCTRSLGGDVPHGCSVRLWIVSDPNQQG